MQILRLFAVGMIAFNAVALLGQQPGIKIAVVDSGIDVNNPLLMEHVWTNPLENPDNDIDDDHNNCVDDVRGCNVYTGSGYGNNDPHGHGTFISGIYAGQSDVPWMLSPEQTQSIELIPVRVLTTIFSNGRYNVVGSEETFTKGVAYCNSVAKQVKGHFIMSISWVWLESEEPKALTKLFKEAGKAGILIVAAAGNEGNSTVLSYPASLNLPHLISVGSLSGKQFALYSSTGADIAAQGSDITSFTLRSQKVKASGTSLAVPMVVLAAAAVWQKHPGLTAAQVKQRLLLTADVDELLAGKVSNNRRLNFTKAVSY
jgi:major intracellular serine protease